MIIGYTTRVFDLFHIGYLNMLKNAKAMCDKLIVGVTTDELVSYKNKKAVIPFEEIFEIIRSIKYIDAAIPQESMDKFEAWKKLKFDIMFVVMIGTIQKNGTTLKTISRSWCKDNLFSVYKGYIFYFNK